ncbi:GntR family transcriptional regulator [Cereibacter sphaeroides]|uniref:GntR family transcriptional regulator n=1 Tax=Cereibacter sphaeroides TaxID=1063 RepID=UPI000A6606E7|nr:GntR family transcriptional regulator [Cereibacter sphaeroides]
MTADLGQIESVTIQLQVYNRLREALFTGKLLPGESLTIRNLAAMLGTSPMPVREALAAARGGACADAAAEPHLLA